MPRVGSDFASYRIQGVLGRGGMSVVFRADNMRLGNEVALKVLSAELSENDAFRERFVRESRLAASINHPNIIPIYDAGEEDGLLYIAMRFVAGADLKTLIRQEGPLSLRRSAELISQVARGLSVAHQRGLIHRDIKPANILTERAGADGETVDHAYLADFGLMKHQVSRSGLTDTGQFLGTVDYVAPEQVEGRQTRPSRRRLLAGLRALRVPDGLRAVPARQRRRGALRARPGHGPADHRPAAGSHAGDRRDLRAGDGEAARAPLRQRARDLSRDLSEPPAPSATRTDRPSRATTEPTIPPRGTALRRVARGRPVSRARRPGAALPGRPAIRAAAAGSAARPPRGRPSTLVIALVVALAAALGVIAFQLDERQRLGVELRRPGTTASPSGTTAPPHRRHGHDGADRWPGRRRAICGWPCRRTCSPTARTSRRRRGARVAQLLGALELRDHVRRLDVPGHRRGAGRLQDPARVTGDPDQHERLHQAQLERRAGRGSIRRARSAGTSRAISTRTTTP